MGKTRNKKTVEQYKTINLSCLLLYVRIGEYVCVWYISNLFTIFKLTTLFGYISCIHMFWIVNLLTNLNFVKWDRPTLAWILLNRIKTYIIWRSTSNTIYGVVIAVQMNWRSKQYIRSKIMKNSNILFDDTLETHCICREEILMNFV